jgi:DNA-binding CsgD family transcriptional regulator
VSPHLWEREAALAALSTLVEGARSGRGGTVFLVGEGGLGKTTLLDWAVDGASGMRMGRAYATAAEASLPFGLVGMALAGLDGGAVLDEVLGTDSHAARPARLYRSLRWLTQAASQGPLLVAIDDLHWGDPDSLDLLGFLCRRMAGLPAAVVATLRPWPPAAAELASELAWGGQAVVAELAPLSPAGGAGLLGDLLGAELPAAQAGELWRACGGNPLLLQLAAGSLSAGHERPRLGPAAGLERRMLLARFAGVGSSALRYARAAAIFGPRFRTGLAGPLAGLDEPESTAALQALCAAGLLVDASPGWAAFSHPLFAEALADDTAAPVRARLHAGAFRLLVAAEVDPSEAAGHAVAASLVGDPQAVVVLERAGRAAFAQGALSAATAHLSHAAELAGADPPAGLVLTLAEALVAQGRTADASELCRGVLGHPDVRPRARVDALRVLARAGLAAGRPDELQAHFEEAAEAARADSAAAVSVLAEAAVSCLLSSPPRWVAAQVAKARALLPAGAAEPAALLAAAGYVAVLGGDPAGAPEVGAAIRSVDSGMDPGWPNGEWHLRVNKMNVNKALERFEDAEATFAAGYRRAEEIGSPVAIGAYVIAHADTLHRLGRLEEALGLIDRAEQLAVFGYRNPWGGLARAILLDEAGRPQESAAAAAQVQQAAGSLPDFYPIRWLWLRLLDARRDLAAGHVGMAAAGVDRIRELAATAGIVEPCVVPWASMAIATYLAASRVAEARAVLEELEAVVEPLPCRWPRAAAAVGRALLAEQDRDPASAEAHFVRALGLHAQVAMPLAEADTLIRYGVFLRHCGAPKRAREPLGRALQLAEACGGGRLAGLAAAELAACGGRRRRRPAADATLTAQELRVAELAAAGCSNPEIGSALFISAKTVEHHLGRIYAKLAVRSRRELMRNWRAPAPGPDRE